MIELLFALAAAAFTIAVVGIVLGVKLLERVRDLEQAMDEIPIDGGTKSSAWKN